MAFIVYAWAKIISKPYLNSGNTLLLLYYAEKFILLNQANNTRDVRREMNLPLIK